MSTKSLSINSASGANSTQAQEQVVKSFSSSSSNLNNVEVDDEVEEFDLDDYKYDYHTGNPAVYVGTYHKYNCGSLFGMWLDLTTFADYDEFCAVCRFLHRDEADPELMCQDYANFPEEWYSEDIFSEDIFDLIQEFAKLDEDEREAYEAFLDVRCDSRISVEDFRDAYQGEWDSEEDFARHIVEECGMFDNLSESVKDYFDFERYADDLFRYDYDFQDGYVFLCC